MTTFKTLMVFVLVSATVVVLIAALGGVGSLELLLAVAVGAAGAALYRRSKAIPR